MENDIADKILFLGNYKNPDFSFKLAQALSLALGGLYKSGKQEAVVLCIGSDKTIGDCFGPLCGSVVKKGKTAHVFGSLEKPVHMHNLHYYTDNISYGFPDSAMICVDAAKSGNDSIGDVYLICGAIVPGNSNFSGDYAVGDLTIVCVTENAAVEAGEEKVRLNDILSMASAVGEAVLMGMKNSEKKQTRLKGSFLQQVSSGQ